MNNKRKPANEIRFGTIKATIWENQFGDTTRFNTQFSRVYKDGDEWKRSDSFGRDDLLVLAKLADHAHTWIHAQSSSGG